MNMKTTDFNKTVTSTALLENIEKQFGSKVNLAKYDREQLEDFRNKIRTRIFQREGTAGVNDLLTNETYQKDKAMLELLNTRIKEMLGEDIKQLRDKMIALSEGKKEQTVKKKCPPMSHVKKMCQDGKTVAEICKMHPDCDHKELKQMIADCKSKMDEGKNSKPDFLDLDNDGNTEEPMKKAAADKKKNPFAKVKEGFPTVAQAKAEHEKNNKGTGKFDKKETNTGTQYKRKSNTFVNGEEDKPITVKKVKEAMKHPADCGCKECMIQETQGKKNWIAGATKNKGGLHKALGVPQDEKIPKSKLTVKPSDSTKLKKEKTLAKTLSKMHESQFKHNVRFVNESIGFLLQEDEEGKAKTITAASDIVNDFTGWMQRVGQYQTKAIIELADSIRADFGAAEAEAFKQAVSPALSSTLEVLTQQRETISNAVATLAGESVPENPMGQEPDLGTDMEPGMDKSSLDDMNPVGDEFSASDAAAGGDATSGREMRESKQQRRVRKLSEAHSIMSKLAS